MVPSMLAAGGTILGAYMTAGGNKDASREAGKWNQINQQSAQAHADKWNEIGQQNFLQQLTNGVSIRAADARRAGISPLAAMGAQGASPMGFTAGLPGGSRQGGVHNAGATYGRATAQAAAQIAEGMRRKARKQERQQDKAFNAELQGAQLQNELARTRLMEEKFNLHARTTMAAMDAANAPKTAYIDLVQNAGAPLKPGYVRVMGPEMAQGTEGIVPAIGSATANMFGTVRTGADSSRRYIVNKLTRNARRWAPGRSGRWNWPPKR